MLFGSAKRLDPATFLVTRASEDAERVVSRLEAMGYRAVSWPLFRTEWLVSEIENLCDGPLPGAVIVSSRRGLMALSMIVPPEVRGSLLLASVGEATASYARSLGFLGAMALGSTAGALMERLETWLPHKDACDRCWYLSGEEITHDIMPGLLRGGWNAERRVVYRMVATMPDFSLVAKCLRPVVCIFSQKAAMQWLSYAQREGQPWQDIAVSCLSRSIEGWLSERGVRWVVAPSRPSLEAWYAMMDDRFGKGMDGASCQANM